MKSFKSYITDIEEVEQVNELNTSTLQSYVQKRGNIKSRMDSAIKSVETGSNKHSMGTAGLKRAEVRIDKERKKQTGMNPQLPKGPIGKDWPIGSRFD